MIGLENPTGILRIWGHVEGYCIANVNDINSFVDRTFIRLTSISVSYTEDMFLGEA